ncbi:MAG: pyridoxal phosphate-dependent aminotransferase [Pseudomonadota bacterium]|nr:pyridoxal phosphate-dependent aminotransferase [Pseudomonadota bacterium]MEC8282307.1 pyridoxal phosphate-dependent aminotransferase [Pseudomonadota bacterium]MEC8676102.1 pyridoxal phosphate-dependent aminotransferase [Pseudomonadota bacterium]MED5337237.1 pyridoxal phosphate-dependent aminotransferase [Pseudomonadota bacterium]
MAPLADRMTELGTETAFEVLARANALAAQGRDIINLGIGQPDFKTPAHIVEAAVKALRDGHHGYTPAQGIPELREAVAADLAARHGAAVDPGQVLILPGGKVTMFFAMLIYGQPGAEIMYPNPGFPIYESAIRFSGATPVPMVLREENGFAFSAAEVLDQITERTRLIILNSPANPTGGAVPRAEFDALIAGLAQWPKVTVMADEIYSQMLYDGREHVSLLQYPEIQDRLIVLDGWSKTYAMTGWRLGMSVWPKDVIGHAEKLAVNCHSCVNAPTQFAGLAALTGPQDAVHEMVAAFDGRRRVIVDALNGLDGVSCVEPGGAFYAFPNITGTGMDAKTLQTRLLEEAGVAVIAGTSFGAHGEGYLRFSYANSTENIVAAIDRIGAMLAAGPAAARA